MKTIWVAWVFNGRAFSEMMKDAVSSLGSKEVAQLLGVSISTVNAYCAARFDSEHPHPSMTNFLLVCNLCDKAPAEFFTTEEGNK